MMNSSSVAHIRVMMEPWDLNFKSKVKKKSSKYLDFIYLLLSLELATVLFFKHHPWCSLNFPGSSAVKCSLVFVSLGEEALTPLWSWQMTQDQAWECNKWLFLYLMAVTATKREELVPQYSGQGLGWQAMHSTCQWHHKHCGRDSGTVTKPQSPKSQRGAGSTKHRQFWVESVNEWPRL